MCSLDQAGEMTPEQMRVEAAKLRMARIRQEFQGGKVPIAQGIAEAFSDLAKTTQSSNPGQANFVFGIAVAMAAVQQEKAGEKDNFPEEGLADSDFMNDMIKCLKD